jgi:YD repeat-containing protein
MRNTPVRLVLAVTILLSSCTKNNNTSGSNSSSLPKTYTEDIRSSIIGNSVTIYDLTYDVNNRITALTATPPPPSLNFVYAYPTTNTVTLDLYEGGVLGIHEIYLLNSSSLVDSTFQFDDSGDTTTEKYIYNGSKQLIQQNTYNFSTSGTVLSNTTNFTYDNLGNVISSVDNQGKSIAYSYYTNLPNTLNLGQTFLPQTINFVQTATLTSGGSTETVNHFYTFDSSNRLIKDSASTVEIDLIAIKSYTY